MVYAKLAEGGQAGKMNTSEVRILHSKGIKHLQEHAAAAGAQPSSPRPLVTN